MNYKNLLRPAGLLAATCFAISGSGLMAAGVTHTLTTTGANVWDTATWTNGAPTSASAGDIAIYNTSVTSSTTTLDTNVTVGTVRLGTTGPWTISAGLGTLTLDNTGGGLNFAGLSNASIYNASGSGGFTVNAPITIANTNLDIGTNGGALNVGSAITASGTQALNFRSLTAAGAINLSGSVGASGGTINISNLTTVGTGTVTISGNLGTSVGSVTQNSTTSTLSLTGANSSYTGGVTLTAGRLSVGSNTALGATSSTLTIADNTSLNASVAVTLSNNNAINVNGNNLTFVGTNTLNLGTGAFTLGAAVTNFQLTASASTLTFGTSLTQTTAGSNFTKLGGGTVVFTAAGGYTGLTTLGVAGNSTSAGLLTLSGAGDILSSAGNITIAGTGSKLTLDNATTNNNNRIADSSDVIFANGGEFSLSQNAATNSSETFNNISLTTGSAIITSASATSRVTTLAASGFSRGSNNATALVRGSTLGGQATNVGRVTLVSTAGLTQVGTSTSSSGLNTGTVKDLTIVPYLLGDTSASGAGNNFLTYDTTSGFRALGTNEYTTLTAGYTGGVNPENVKAFNGTLTTGSNVTVNSLLFNTASQTLNGSSGALVVNSGAIASVNTAAVVGSGFSGITLGNGTWNEGVLTATTGNALQINAPISVTGSGGLTKAGAGTLTLTGSSLYSGATTVNQGTLKLGDGTTDGALASSGINTLSGATTNFNNVNSSTFSGALSGSGSYSKTGAGTLILSGSGAGTGSGVGNLAITVGSVQLNSVNALQNTTATLSVANALTFGNGIGTFNLGGLAGTTGLALVDLSSTAVALQIGANNSNTSYSGILSGAGSLVKVGTGTSTITATSGNSNTYAGGTTIKSGTLQANGFAGTQNPLGTGSVYLGDTSGSANATLGFDQTGTVSNPIIVQAGTSGILTIRAVNTSGGLTTAGPITLNNNLVFETSATQNGGNSYTGGITGTGNITLLVNASGASSTIAFSGSNPLNFAGTITNSGTGSKGASISSAVGANVTSIIQNSATSGLTLSGSNTAFAGTVDIQAGTLTGGGTAALNAANTVNLTSGAALVVGANFTLGGLNGSGTVSRGAADASSRVLTIGGSGSYSTSGTLQNSGGAGNLGLTKSGSGTQTLSGTTSYTGATAVSGGKLIVDMSGAGTFAGGGALTLTNGGEFALKGTTSGAVKTAPLGVLTSTTSSGPMGIFTLQDGVNSTAASYTAGGVILVRGTNLGLNAASTTGSANFFLTAPPTITGLGTTSATTLARIIGDTSATGSGTGFVTYDTNGVRLLAAGEYSSTVAAGTNVKATSAITNTATTTVNSLFIGPGGSISGGTEIRLTSGDVLVAGGVNSGITTALSNQGAGGLVITALNDLAGGNINGGGTVFKYGSGTTTFNTVDAVATVNEGIFSVNGGNKLKSGNVVNNTGTLRISGSGSVIDASSVTVNAGGTFELVNGISEDIGNLNALAGGFVKGGSGSFANLGVTGGTVDGIISGNLNVTQRGTGTMTLNGANTFAGSTAITGGTMTVGASGKLGAGDLTISNTNTGAGTAVVANLNSSQSVGSLNGTISTPTSGTNTVTTNLAVGTTLTVNQGVNGTYAGVLAGSGNFTKTGSATLALTGANTNTGTTTVSSGTLLVNGSMNLGSTISVTSGGTLGGSGTVNGIVTVANGGTLSPGNSPGLPVFTDDLLFQSGSTFKFELIANTESGRGTNYDGVDLTGAGSLLTIDAGAGANLVFNSAGSTVLWSDSFWNSSHSWLLFDNTNAPVLGSPTNIFDSLSVGLDSGGFSTAGAFSFSKDLSGDIFLNYSMVPEPSTWALLAFSLTTVIVLRRRKKV